PGACADQSSGYFRMIDEPKTESTSAGVADVPLAAGAAQLKSEPASPPPGDERALLSAGIVGALKTVYDPEIPADIYELGLIYKVDVDYDRMVKIANTRTTPNWPSVRQC